MMMKHCIADAEKDVGMKKLKQEEAISALQMQELSETQKPLDTISRQAVIKAIGMFIPADPMKNDYTQGISVGLAIATRCIEEFSQETDESSQGLVKDLISKQAAIDAINNIMPTKEGFYEPAEVLWGLMQLPSVQPIREDYAEMKREFLRMASYIDSLLVCPDEQKETLMNFISRIAKEMPWTQED
jgi:hypothetical protein